jgi:cytochrome P450
MLAADPAEAHTQLAGPLPVEIIADLLGIPEGDRPDFRTWSDEIVEAMAVGVGENPLAPSAIRDYVGTIRSATRLLSFFDELIAERQRDPGEDLISALARSEQEGGLSNSELFWFTLLLLVAGNETTTSLINGLLLALATSPAEFERLRDDPERIPTAVEEGLRWTSPVQAFFREARAPYDVAGVTIPARSRVMLAFGAANRDPTVYDDPDAFRLDRPEGTKHLAFGSGIHFCLGAHLARLEATGVVEELIRRVETIGLAGEPVWARNPSLRQIRRLPLRIS